MLKSLSEIFQRQAKSSLIIIAAGIITFISIIWASFAKVEEVTHTTGLVIASSRNQVIQSAIDGIIQSIPVQEGQSVQKGMVLANLERTQAEAAQYDSFGKVAALEAALARLHAEVLGRPLEFPENVRAYPQFIENQTELYQRRKAAIDSEIRTLQESLRLAKEELSMMAPLLESGDVGKIEVIRLQRQVAELTGQINMKRNKFFQDAQQEMTKYEEDLSTQKQLLAERSFVVGKLDVRAPVTGIVKKIHLTTQGAKVRPGDIVMELLPTEGNLIVEGKLKPSDIGFVKPGMAATVKVDAYDYSIYGVLHGKVSYISPDAITEQTPQGEALYYRVHVKLTDESTSQSKISLANLQPGMTVGIDIRTGSKTVLQYLTKPITKVFGESLRER